jgi:hypothetical protein
MLVSLDRSAGGVSARRYTVAIVAVLLALLAKLLLNPLILRESPFLMFFAAVTAAAWYGSSSRCWICREFIGAHSVSSASRSMSQGWYAASSRRSSRHWSSTASSIEGRITR